MYETRKGLVFQGRLFKDLKTVAKQQASAAGIWSRIKHAFDDVRLGERDDIVMAAQQGYKLTELVIITYRETLGADPKVRISPVLSLVLAPDAVEDTTLWFDAGIEVGSRLMELRAAVAASGGSDLKVSVTGKPALAERLVEHIRAVSTMTPGGDIILNGERISGGLAKTTELLMEEAERNRNRIGPSVDMTLGALLQWEINDNIKDEDWVDRHAAMLELAESDAWWSALSRPGDRDEIRIDLRDLIEDAPPLLAGSLRRIDDMDALHHALVRSKASPMLQAGAKVLLGTGDFGDMSKCAAWSTEDKLNVILALRRSVAILKADPEHWHIALGLFPSAMQVGNDMGPAAFGVIGMAAREQTIADVQTLAASALRHAKRVTLDLAGFVPKREGEDPCATVIEDVLDGIDDAKAGLPEGAEIGNVRFGTVDASYIEALYGPR